MRNFRRLVLGVELELVSLAGACWVDEEISTTAAGGL